MNRSRRPPSVGPAQRSAALPSLCAGLCLLLAPLAPAHAAKWQNVAPGGKSTQARVDIDTASIDRAADGKVRAWHREVYPAQRLQESWAFSYASVTQLSEFHCDKRSVAPVRRLYLAADGSELKSEGFDGKDATPVVPDTPLEKVLNHLCRKPSAALPAATAPQMPTPAAATPAVTEQPPASQTPGKPRGKGQKEEVPPPPPPKPPAPWSYDGKLGPAKWSKLSDDYALCGDGKRQSPIDIRTPIRADLAPIRFAWQSMPLAIVDTGHGMQVNADGGTIVVDGEEYQLQHFRFHHPGETMVNGKRAVMSVQFEHRSPSGRIAVVAVPLVEGKENRLARTLLSALPLEPGKVASPAGVKIDPGQLIPQKRDYATYVGSLTTPPCTEGVLWLVLKHPVSVSREQIADFAKIYKNNVRPLQAANGRVIKESR